MKNEMRLIFPSHSYNEAFARAAVGAFCVTLDPTVEELEDIKTAVSEAVTNAIVHGYPEELGPITLTGKIPDEDTVEITVKDRGRGIPDVAAAMEPLFTTGGSERSGMGFTIMEKFMTALKVRSEPGKGTTIVMRRKLCRRGARR